MLSDFKITLEKSCLTPIKALLFFINTLRSLIYG